VIKQIDKNTGMCMSLAARPGNFGCRFFNYLFGELGINFIYRSIAPADLADALKGMRALKIRGSALSMPYKELAIPLMDHVDEAARKIGAINTVVNDEGKLTGYNTDYLGVRKCLLDKKIESKSKVILLGSGGMARAIAFALHDLGFGDTTIVARNAETRKNIAGQYGFSDAETLVGLSGDLLVNATPIGMQPDDPSTLSFPDEKVTSAKAVMESVAEPVDTGIVKLAGANGKEIINGLDIITNQAIEQFRLYFGQTLDLELAKRAATHAKAT
jgi:shikimate dehydrogenase